MAEDVPLVPPQATIDDVLALLAQGPSPEFREQVAAARAFANRSDPPPDASVSTRINFYYQRGLAAMNAGLVGQAIRDFARSLDVGAGTGTLARAQALQQTMIALIDRGGSVAPQTKQVVFSYAHPMFWAPFTLVGDGGERSTAR